MHGWSTQWLKLLSECHQLLNIMYYLENNLTSQYFFVQVQNHQSPYPFGGWDVHRPSERSKSRCHQTMSLRWYWGSLDTTAHRSSTGGWSGSRTRLPRPGQHCWGSSTGYDCLWHSSAAGLRPGGTRPCWGYLWRKEMFHINTFCKTFFL